MSALGQKQTFQHELAMSALTSKADIDADSFPISSLHIGEHAHK